MITSRVPHTEPSLPARGPRRRRTPFMQFVGGLSLLGIGSIVGFLAGAGTGAIWSRLVPEAPDVLSLNNDDPGIRIMEDNGVLVAKINPRSVRMDLAQGWDVEREAFQDTQALLYFTGPFFEEQRGPRDYNAKAIGDLYFNRTLSLASEASRGFADRRYFMALTAAQSKRKRRVAFGYGGWKDGYQKKYRVFVGGLGFLYDTHGDNPAAGYSDPYAGLRQKLHDAVPRERLIVGKDKKGSLMVLKTPPRTSSQASEIARKEGLLEAYYVDQGNKARFIAPGQIDDKPRFNLPYLLRIADPENKWDPQIRQPEPRKRKKKRRPRPDA